MTKQQTARPNDEAVVRRARRVAARVPRDTRTPATTLQPRERDALVATRAELAAAIADMIRCRDEIGGELGLVTRQMTALTAYSRAGRLAAAPAKPVRQ